MIIPVTLIGFIQSFRVEEKKRTITDTAEDRRARMGDFLGSQEESSVAGV